MEDLQFYGVKGLKKKDLDDLRKIYSDYQAKLIKISNKTGKDFKFLEDLAKVK